jgi:hypothetical protein
VKSAALVVAGGILGAAVTLAILAVVIPSRLFGVSGDAIAYSIGSYEPCDRVGQARWRCAVVDGGESLEYTYSVVVSPDGCWEARSPSAEPLDGCLGFWDYVRPLKR